MANVRLPSLESLERRLYRPSLFKAWGQHLERRMVTAFRTETSPAGQAWADLTPATKKSKRSKNRRPKSRYPNKILRDTGGLYQSISSQILTNGVRTGANRQVNHFEKVKPAKLQSAPKRDNPFTSEEVRLFISAIKTDQHYFST